MFKYIFCFSILALGTQAVSPPNSPCDLPKKTGPCRAYFLKYYFNRQSGKCERFVYGGCKGNENNFDSLAECESTCAGSKCSDVMCLMYCENGFDVDENGCEICKCKPPKCSDAMCMMYCEHGFQLDKNGCQICKCNPPPICTEVMCLMYCQHGYEVDNNGCQTCQCKPPPKCSDVMCMMYCEYGFQKDENGCEICKCNPHPSIKKPGKCPRDSFQSFMCPLILHLGDCTGDGSCPGSQKCCPYGCRTRCAPAGKSTTSQMM